MNKYHNDYQKHFLTQNKSVMRCWNSRAIQEHQICTLSRWPPTASTCANVNQSKETKNINDKLTAKLNKTILNNHVGQQETNAFTSEWTVEWIFTKRGSPLWCSNAS
jgi:hypothetical protein